MCMLTIERRTRKLPVTRAWKVFTVGRECLFTPYRVLILRVGVWHQAKRRRIREHTSYLSGFHTFDSAEAAQRYMWDPAHMTVREVEIRGAAYYGIQHHIGGVDGRGWTAAEMRILPLRRKVGKE
jgi:hypothetical protein